jgi:hypothetical protein
MTLTGKRLSTINLAQTGIGLKTALGGESPVTNRLRNSSARFLFLEKDGVHASLRRNISYNEKRFFFVFFLSVSLQILDYLIIAELPNVFQFVFPHSDTTVL